MVEFYSVSGMETFSTLLFVATLCVAAQAIKIEDAYDRCRGVKKEEVAPCVVNLVNDLRPLIENGIPELGLTTDDVPIGDLDFQEFSGENFISVQFTKPKARGFHDLTMKRLEIDYENNMVRWAILHPEYLFSSDYVLESQILFFPLTGEGKCWFRVKDLLLKGESKFELQDHGGNLYVQEVETDFTFEYYNITARLNNLFGGDPLLMEAGAAFVSQNVDAFIDAMRPSVRKSFKPIGGNTINVILRKIPLTDIAGHEYLKKP